MTATLATLCRVQSTVNAPEVQIAQASAVPEDGGWNVLFVPVGATDQVPVLAASMVSREIGQSLSLWLACRPAVLTVSMVKVNLR